MFDAKCSHADLKVSPQSLQEGEAVLYDNQKHGCLTTRSRRSELYISGCEILVVQTDTHEERQDEFFMLTSSYTSSSSLRPPIRKFLSSFPLIAELQRSGEVFLFHLLFWGFVFKEVWFKSELRGEEESERVEMKPEMEERARRDETRVWLM